MAVGKGSAYSGDVSEPYDCLLEMEENGEEPSVVRAGGKD